MGDLILAHVLSSLKHHVMAEPELRTQLVCNDQHWACCFAGLNGNGQQQDFSRGLNTNQLGSGDMSEYLQQQGLLQSSYPSNGQLQPSSLEALLRNTALVQQLQNNAGGISQSASSNSLAGQYAQEPQMRASASSGNLSMGGNSPPQLSSAHGSHQYLNQAHLSGLGGVDGQYGLGRRTPGGMSMSTGDLAALYEAAQVKPQLSC